MADDGQEPKRVLGRPFQKGESGNPGGRPKTKKVRVKLREWDEEFYASLLADLTGPSGSERTAAMKLFAAYRFGTPSQPLELSGPGGSALVVEVRKLGPGET